MKGILKIVLSSLSLVTLIACGTNTTTSDSSKEPEPSSNSGSVALSSSSEQLNTSSINSSSKQESNATPSSSSVAPSSSSAVVSSSSSSQPVASSSVAPVTYHVVFQNYDGTLLEEKDVLKGSEATYSGQTPVKPEDDEFTYEFKGWDKDLKNIQSDVTTKAEYKAVGKGGWGPVIWF